MVETALKINPSLRVSSPPAWAPPPFTVRGKAFMHQARAYFPVFATQPLECQVFMENFSSILVYQQELLFGEPDLAPLNGLAIPCFHPGKTRVRRKVALIRGRQ